MRACRPGRCAVCSRLFRAAFCALRVLPPRFPWLARFGAARPPPLRGRVSAHSALASLPAPAPRPLPPGSGARPCAPLRGSCGARWRRLRFALPLLGCGLPAVALALLRARPCAARRAPGLPGGARFAASGAAGSRPGGGCAPAGRFFRLAPGAFFLRARARAGLLWVAFFAGLSRARVRRRGRRRAACAARLTVRKK